jgi:hypothetical protein
MKRRPGRQSVMLAALVFVTCTLIVALLLPHTHDALPPRQSIVLPASTLSLDTPIAVPREEVQDDALREMPDGEMPDGDTERASDVTPGAAEQAVPPSRVEQPAAPAPTIRDLLDARWDQRPAGEDELAVAAAAAAVEDPDYVPTFENPISPGFDPEAIVNRYATRAVYEAVMLSVGWEARHLDQMWAIVQCESRGDYSGGPPNTVDGLAVGPGTELGWHQIHPLHWRPEGSVFEDFDLLNPFENSLAALWLFEHGGFGHWSCFTLGRANVE